MNQPMSIQHANTAVDPKSTTTRLVSLLSRIRLMDERISHQCGKLEHKLSLMASFHPCDPTEDGKIPVPGNILDEYDQVLSGISPKLGRVEELLDIFDTII